MVACLCLGLFLLFCHVFAYNFKKRKGEGYFFTGGGHVFHLLGFGSRFGFRFRLFLLFCCVWLCVSEFDSLAVMVWSLLLSKVTIYCVRVRVLCCFCFFVFVFCVVPFLFYGLVFIFAFGGRFVFVSICGCVFVFGFVFVVLARFCFILNLLGELLLGG